MSVGIRSGEGRQDRPATAQSAESADWSDLKGEVGEIAEVAVERGRHFLDATRMQAISYADQRKSDAAQSVADLAQSLREACKAFEDRPNIRAVVNSAADGLEQFADSVRNRSYAEIYGDIEDVMRRRPVTVATATLTLGFFISRFIKASAQNAREAQFNAGASGAGKGRGRRSQSGGGRPSQGGRARSGLSAARPQT
jgi:hypothetical protein